MIQGLFTLPLKIDTEEAQENLQIELIICSMILR